MTTTAATVEQHRQVPRFYLGTHHPHWIWRVTFPLFVSRRQLTRRALSGLRPATCPVGLDSGGFTELAMHGRWTLTAHDYADQVAAFHERLGGLDFAAPMDWMCEPFMLERTGLSVREHQERTVANYLALRSIAPQLPFVPVLQGWEVTRDYLTCVDLYASAGVDLTVLPLVGLGSVCRRQSTHQIAGLVRELASGDLALHAFGCKSGGLARYAHHLASADSLAWSFRARRSAPLPGCVGRHRNCANCLTYATAYRERLLVGLNRPHQLALDEPEVAA